MNKKNLKYYLTGILLTASLVLASSCSGLSFPALVKTTVTTVTVTSGVTAEPTPAWTAPATTTAAPVNITGNIMLPDLQSVVAKVKPSVVAINVQQTVYGFNRGYVVDGAGSGWILDSIGLIATNNHVIEGATSIMVTFDDGTVLPADVVGKDAVSDLAVLKVNKTGLPAVTVGDSSALKVGQWVLAIGNALGEGISVTEGIVSRTGASITGDSGQTLYDLIQTSAAVNPGSSGGPLVNLAGEVVGITSAKLADIGIEGMGYAISTKTALPIIQTLVQKGYVTYPYFGVQTEDVNPVYVLWYGLAVNSGAFVTQVSAGTPASQAGIKQGDVIVSFNGKDIYSSSALSQAIYAGQVEQPVTVVFYRGSSKITAQVTLIKSPAPGAVS